MLPENDKPQKKLNKQLSDYTKYSGIAFQMIAIIAAGVYAGVKLDEWLRFRFPVFTLIFILGSLVLAIYSVIRNLLK